MDELRDEIYYWAIDLVKEGKELEGIFLLLSTWNFAYFRYHMKNFSLDKFKKELKKCDFSFFKNKKFSKVNLDNIKIKNKIISIYSALSNIKGIKYVGATKIMHLKNPNFFVMWDTKIMKPYKAKRSAEGYYEFMKKMQELYKKGEFGKLNKKLTIPRAIDVYNFNKYSQNN